MSVYFIDLDGTLFQHSTNILLPGAVEFLQKLRFDEHMIVLVTRRGNKEFLGDPILSQEATEKMLKEKEIPFDEIVFNVPSPRIIINDEACEAIRVKTNEGVGHLR